MTRGETTPTTTTTTTTTADAGVPGSSTLVPIGQEANEQRLDILDLKSYALLLVISN